MKNKTKIKILKTRDDFIKFFRSIPKKKWLTDGGFHSHGRSCAYGHCGARSWISDTTNSYNLYLLTSGLKIAMINDQPTDSFRQRHAKDRVLAALRELPA